MRWPVKWHVQSNSQSLTGQSSSSNNQLLIDLKTGKAIFELSFLDEYVAMLHLPTFDGHLTELTGGNWRNVSSYRYHGRFFFSVGRRRLGPSPKN